MPEEDKGHIVYSQAIGTHRIGGLTARLCHELEAVHGLPGIRGPRQCILQPSQIDNRKEQRHPAPHVMDNTERMWMTVCCGASRWVPISRRRQNPTTRHDKREASVVRSGGSTATCSHTPPTTMDVTLNTASTLPYTIESNGTNEVQLVPDVWLMIFELLDAKSILRLRRVSARFISY